MNPPALSYRGLCEFARPATNLANFRYVSAWTPAGAGVSQTEFTSNSGRRPAGFAAHLAFLARLRHEPNMGLSVTSHKTALVLHSQVKGPH
jgi:hypothetical protein